MTESWLSNMSITPEGVVVVIIVIIMLFTKKEHFYSIFRGWLGTRSHKKMINPIIATILQIWYLSDPFNPGEQLTYRGCRLQIPLLEAMAPVKNGNNAEPVCPNPAIQPIHPVKIHGGRILAEWFMTIGYMGPRRTPTKETATAPPRSEGTSQTTSSRLK